MPYLLMMPHGPCILSNTGQGRPRSQNIKIQMGTVNNRMPILQSDNRNRKCLFTWGDFHKKQEKNNKVYLWIQYAPSNQQLQAEKNNSDKRGGKPLPDNQDRKPALHQDPWRLKGIKLRVYKPRDHTGGQQMENLHMWIPNQKQASTSKQSNRKPLTHSWLTRAQRSPRRRKSWDINWESEKINQDRNKEKAGLVNLQ